MMLIKTLIEWYMFLFEKLQCYFIAFLLTPGYYILLIFLIQDKIIDTFQPSLFIQWVDFTLSIFGFINVIGNMLLCVLIDTSLKKSAAYGYDYCEHCKMLRPNGTWHCRTCKVCILGRDHHCMFLSRCVGLYNRRYYILYLAHVSIAVIYFNIHVFMYLIHAKVPVLMCLKKILNVMTPVKEGRRELRVNLVDVFLAFFIFNIIIFMWAALLLSYHFKNVICGVTAYEKRHDVVVSRTLVENLKGVFGVRWYLTIICPFVKSPLPNMGLGLKKM